MDMIEKIVNKLERDPRFQDRVSYIEILPESPPVYGEVTPPLPESILTYLDTLQIRLYSHQCEAIQKLRAGKNIIITTPTASGKTLAFTIPIFERMYTNTTSTALYVYPTKALSNDQLKMIKECEKITKIPVNPHVYDGDTPKSIRPTIRNTSRIIISNPYELHYVLPWHSKWQKFFRNLEFIVIDEAHQYRGVFGSNVAFLLKRLKRILSFYGSDPQIILSTATLANPEEFGEKLAGVPFDLIDYDGSPHGQKYFIFYNPYSGDNELSTHTETKDVFLYYIQHNLQTLCFTVSRKMAELITMWSKKELEEETPHIAERITAYRAGYLPEERREIENKLKNGDLLGVTSTNALELGIDIGSLDSVVISGYPGTVISTWQQAGRAGRGTNESVVTLVAFQNPLDQYFMHHPEVFFGNPHEHAIIDLKNPYIVSGHVMCAASELPVTQEDKHYFGNFDGILKVLEIERLIQETGRGWVYTGRGGGRVTEAVQLNTISSDVFKVVDEGKLLETMDRPQAFREAHKGAVLLHQGETYLVEELDIVNGVAYVKKKEVDYYTDVLKIVDISILEEMERKEVDGCTISFGRVKVSEEYTGYRLMLYDKVIGVEPLDLPVLTFSTIGLWVTIPECIKDDIWEIRKKDQDIKKVNMKSDKEIKDELFAGGLHGAEHALIGVMPFHVMCDRWDIGGVSSIYHPDTGLPSIFVYDGFEGGIGLTERAFELLDDIVIMALQLVTDCECEEGCPACIYSPKCGNDNRPLDKKGTSLVLDWVRAVLAKG
jgi:DEAD/DEAH box helicase domain-containing protein